MPVTLIRPSQPTPIQNARERRLRRGDVDDRGRRLRIELVNNMPDAAAQATQRQFIGLLEEACETFEVTLGLMTLSSVERSAEARRAMAELYRSPACLAAAPPDAIIVTGSEPRAAELDQEPYWRELTGLFDAARTLAYGTLASCLAAHALVLHRDGVRRRRSPTKWSGLYRTEVVASHPLAEGLQPGFTPHSRWNGLDEAELAAKGYLALTRVGEAGVDMFVKDDEHLTLFFQGHPEYDGDTLAREYRRDVSRALNGAPAPAPPVNYYDCETERRLKAHVAGMIAGREPPAMPAFAMIGPSPEWRARGVRAIGNWLEAVAARKLAASQPTFSRARFGG
jgi:homoserine O-succinyltransferase